MNSLKRTLIFISLSVVLLMLGSTYCTTLVSLKLSSWNTKESIIGLVHTAFSIGFVLGTLKTEFFIKRIGFIKSFIFFSLVYAVSILGGKFFPSILGWVAIRLLGGICLAALYVILESFYLLISPDEKRGQILSIYMIALYLSQSASQFFYNVIPFESDSIFVLLSSLIFLSCLPILFVKNPSNYTATGSLANSLKNPDISWLGLHSSFASGAILTALYSFLPLLAKKLSLSIPLAMSLMILGGLSFQWPIGYLSDKLDRKKLMIAITLSILIPCSIPFLIPISKLGCYCLIVLIGGFSFALYPLAMTLVCENKPKEDLTALTGLIVLLYSFGMIFGPMLTPYFNMIQNQYGLYIQIILFSVLLTIHNLLGFIKKKAVASD